MFEPTGRPRIFGTPLGVDYPRALVDGLIKRTASASPEAMANIEIFVSTSRMRSRIRALFDDGQTRFLPRLRLITDLSRDPGLYEIPQPVPALRRRLELRQLIAALIEQEPDLAPKAAAFDLADSLADLADEMHSEGVLPRDLQKLDVGSMSAHWERSLKLISLVDRYFSLDMTETPDAETRQRMVIEATVKKWSLIPPKHPVLVAGSTGSRGATAMLMDAVARLPQGAIILPGFDYDLPDHAWQQLDAATAQDHPQYRFARILNASGLNPADVPRWTEDTPATAERNRLVSLALRPAPVTDQWQVEGKGFQNVASATQNMTLVETRAPREEALTIAVLLRRSVEDGVPVALITPDRNLTRQVTAALDRWRIVPDDSAGRPLALSAPGRFLSQITQLMCEDTSSEMLLALLKHPLTHSAAGTRGDHLRWTRDLEIGLLRGLYAHPTADALRDWAAKFPDEPARAQWASWVGAVFIDQVRQGPLHLEQLLGDHITLAEQIARGTHSDGSGELWMKAAGQSAYKIVSDLAKDASYGGEMSTTAFRDLLRSVLNGEVVRDSVSPHSGVMIWGTLEARVQGADRVILAGLNDGTWPETPGPDPWLNRQMRKDAGLLLPERRIGLSAHDFQQAIATKEVILTRSTRDEESETIPSRWLNRLCNLMGGMSEQGNAALKDMRARGQELVKLAGQLDTPEQQVAPAPRPSPAPPVSTRPTQLSATGVTKLIRDPYAVYADKVLHLRPLPPVRPTSDALIRGTVLHHIFERYVTERAPPDDPNKQSQHLMTIADEVLELEVPWPSVRILWRARIERIADWFVRQEAERRRSAENLVNEAWGQVTFEQLGFTLGAKADRIDRQHDGALVIYDYKSGEPPTEKMQRNYDKQLLLEAIIANLGGFRDVSERSVAAVSYIGLSPKKEVTTPINASDIDATRAELLTLIDAYYRQNQGFTARRAVHKQRFDGDYDHLARFGEWDDSDDPVTLPLTLEGQT
ncbi:double-strand break repair protein AddB [Aliiroseovarius sp. 2305UL8-7]|uniref:double-strand break repair protein AddB n=1 Tax=Aliiroseovarius conchicola TaxID=3121637 RepID=UPI0035270F6C